MATAWSDIEVLKLLEAWGDENIQAQLDGSTRNIKVYAAIAQRLLESGGIQRTAVKCREKIKKLKAEYKQIKNHNNRSGRNGKTCKFLPQLYAILGHRSSTTPPVVLYSSSNQNGQHSEGAHSPTNNILTSMKGQS